MGFNFGNLTLSKLQLLFLNFFSPIFLFKVYVFLLFISFEGTLTKRD